jgi:dipeptidyl-peptidase-3
MLREVQRIKSQGDTEAGRRMVEDYGVKLDPAIHKQVLDRAAPFKPSPYSGFMNPRMVPVTQGDEIVDIKLEHDKDFVEQHLEYHRKYFIEL